ncbi:MAG TPA: alpha/beta fold hydrolase, partial [Kofleriaceae bacterium]|nr:alpha/beta fold hydrolase [Kofleriaceae bacterium]
GTRRGTIVCLHAMMTDGRYFGARRDRGFAHLLAGAGYDVVIVDFRGHGQSTPLADWSFDDLVELDLPAIVQGAGCPPEELVVLGHSLGGLATMAALGNGAIPGPRAVILATTNVWLGGDLRRRAVMSVYRRITALLGRAPIRTLRLGTADEAATYVRQLTGWSRTGRWTSLRGVDHGAQLARISTRVLPIAGSGDWMCTPADARAFVAPLPNAAPVRIVDGADHFALFTQRPLARTWRELLDRL